MRLQDRHPNGFGFGRPPPAGVHKLFGASDSIGVMDALDPQFPLDRALEANEVANLRIMATGGLPLNPTEVVASARFAHLLGSVSSVADLVMLDSPPMLGLADASALASRVDGESC